MPIQILLDVYAALFGLIVGSYLNVVIHRLPRGVSTVLPRSRCGHCGSLIRARDNVPVLSWLLLRGRCRQCGTIIAWRYPVIEALTGLLFVAAMERFGPGVEAAVAALFGSLLIALAAIDAEHFILPDQITLPGIAVGMAVQPLVPWAGVGQALLGALLGAGLLLAAWGGWYLLRGEEGMGLGDVKMLAMVGAFLGWKGVLVTLFFGSLLGAVVGLALIATGRGALGSKLPFGSFLAAGAAIALFWGRAMAEAYLGLF